MHFEPALLARYEGFGSVARCGHGFVHVQVGLTTLTLTEAQYQRVVALLMTDSAVNFERERLSETDLGSEAYDRQASESGDAEYPDILPN